MRGKILASLIAIRVFAQAPAPHIVSMVSAADFQPGVAVEGYGSLFGEGFADGAAAADRLPLPLKLQNTEVLACGSPVVLARCVALPLAYVSPGQINFIAPAAAAGVPLPDLLLVVRRDGKPDSDAAANAAAAAVRFEPVAPRIFPAGSDCALDRPAPDEPNACATPRGTVTDAAGRLITSANPAYPGAWYSVWLTGLGAAPGGAAAVRVSLRIADIPVTGSPPAAAFDYGTPDYAGSAAVPGLYQINFRLPENLAVSGDCLPGLPCGHGWELSLEISAAGQPANIVRIPVMPAAAAGTPPAPPPGSEPPPTAPDAPKK